MNKRTEPKLRVDSYQIYSLDRCIKCLGVLNLGQKSFCTVGLKKVKSGKATGGADASTDWLS